MSNKKDAEKEILDKDEALKSQAETNADLCDEDIITIVSDDEEQGLKAKLDETERQNLELSGMLKRFQNEFDNYRRRTQEKEKSAREDGQNELIEKLLPLLDAFESACKLIKDESVLQGVLLILKQLETVLSGYGVSKIDALGQEFNPEVHNAVFAKDDPENAGRVLEVIKTGYLRGEKVLRYAFVVVGQ